MLDYTTIMVAVSISCAAVMASLLANWMTGTGDRYLLSWALGLAFITPALWLFGLSGPDALPAFFAGFTLLLVGGGFVLAGAYQFRLGTARAPLVVGLTAGALAVVALPYLFGLTGLATIVANLAFTALFGLAGVQYWLARAEAPLPLTIMSLLYGAICASMALCALVLGLEGALIIAEPPRNWAETLASLVVIVSLVGIGTLALTVRQMRTVRHHRDLAMSDQLTGLANRRAIFAQYARRLPRERLGVVLFDLDRFKRINDTYGHAAGDSVLVAFAHLLQNQQRGGVVPARLGGEEFCLLVPGADPSTLFAMAERIRRDLREGAGLEHLGGMTVSAGYAVADENETFAALLERADQALYRAKGNGRDQVQGAAPQLAA